MEVTDGSAAEGWSVQFLLGGGKTAMNDEQIRRLHLKDALRAELETTLDERVARYFSVNHQSIIAGHHFAAASAECLDLYRDGDLPEILGPRFPGKQPLFAALLNTARRTPPG